MATKVTDPDGVQWSVTRLSWAWDYDSDSGSSWESALFDTILFVLSIAVTWPSGFIACWLGMLPWEIVIEHDGFVEGRERVRGRGKSQRRIQEIAELVAAGMWQPKHQA